MAQINKFRKSKKNVLQAAVDAKHTPVTEPLAVGDVLVPPENINTHTYEAEKELETAEKIASKIGFQTKERALIPLDEIEDAPEGWNDFPSLSNLEIEELAFSIEQNGLYHPFVLWKKYNNKTQKQYMILSGHNRAKAYRRLIEKYTYAYEQGLISKEQFDIILERLSNVPAVVYEENEITDTKAQEIIMDINYNGRKNIVPLLPILVQKRYSLIQNTENLAGQRYRDLVATALEISPTKVGEELSIMTHGSYNIKQLYFTQLKSKKNYSNIKKKHLLKIVMLSSELQNTLIDYYSNNPEEFNQRLDLLFRRAKGDKSKITKEFIDEIFQQELKKEDVYTRIEINIPEKYKSQFMNLYNNWLKENNIEP